MTKICSKCGKDFPATAEFFNRAERGLYGLRPECKDCSGIWRENNKDKIKSYYINDKENYIEKATKWNRNNKNRRKEICKKDYESHPERFKIHDRKRRARKYGLTEHHTTEDVETLYREQFGKCYYCGESMYDYHLEHKTPLSRGGTDTKENLAISCPDCNWRKNDRTEEEFFVYLLRVDLEENYGPKT